MLYLLNNSLFCLKHVTKSQNRCAGCLASHHMSRYRKTEDFPKQHRQGRFCKSSIAGSVRDDYPLLRLGIAFKPPPPSAAYRQCSHSNHHAQGSYWIRGEFRRYRAESILSRAVGRGEKHFNDKKLRFIEA